MKRKLTRAQRKALKKIFWKVFYKVEDLVITASLIMLVILYIFVLCLSFNLMKGMVLPYELMAKGLQTLVGGLFPLLLIGGLYFLIREAWNIFVKTNK